MIANVATQHCWKNFDTWPSLLVKLPKSKVYFVSCFKSQSFYRTQRISAKCSPVCLRRLKSEKKIQNLEGKKISSFVIKRSKLLWDLTYFNRVKFNRNFRSCSKNWIEKQDGRFVAMVIKDLRTLNLKFDQIMFNSLAFTWERNFVVINHNS